MMQHGKLSGIAVPTAVTTSSQSSTPSSTSSGLTKYLPWIAVAVGVYLLFIRK